MPDTFTGVLVKLFVSGPKDWVVPAASVTEPGLADRMKGLAFKSRTLSAPKVLPNVSSTVEKAVVVCGPRAPLVSDRLVDSAPDTLNDTPVSVPKELLNKPNTPL